LVVSYDNAVITYIYIYEMEGHVAHVGETRGEFRVLVGRSEGKRSLGIPSETADIKMVLQEIGQAEPWTGLVWHRIA
jgi:hypothetical protein